MEQHLRTGSKRPKIALGGARQTVLLGVTQSGFSPLARRLLFLHSKGPIETTGIMAGEVKFNDRHGTSNGESTWLALVR